MVVFFGISLFFFGSLRDFRCVFLHLLFSGSLSLGGFKSHQIPKKQAKGFIEFNFAGGFKVGRFLLLLLISSLASKTGLL